MVTNKISVKVSPEFRNKLMTDGLNLYLKSHPERATNPPKFDEMFCMAVEKYVHGYIIDPQTISFFKKFIPEMFPKEELEEQK